MSAVLGPLPLDQLPKSKPVTPMLSCLVSPGTTVLLAQPSLVVHATGSTRGGQLRFPGHPVTVSGRARSAGGTLSAGGAANRDRGSRLGLAGRGGAQETGG